MPFADESDGMSRKKKKQQHKALKMTQKTVLVHLHETRTQSAQNIKIYRTRVCLRV